MGHDGCIDDTQARKPFDAQVWRDDCAVIDAQMGDFRGRIAGDRLVEQAVLLNDGRYTEYETLFGKLGPA